MAFSSGTFSRLFDWTTDRDAGVKIRADRFDQELDGFATGLTTTILKDGTQTTTAVVPFAFGISIVDNKAITLGTNSDITIQYDETTNDSLEIAAAVEGAALGIVLKSDQGDDNADQHKLSIADGGTLTLASKISGSFVTYLTHTPNSTVASSTLAVAGNLTVGGNLTLGSGAELSEAELEMLDGITAGTVAASKAVVVDSNKDIASFRNITLTGELDAGSLDVSGDADIDGTLEADAITVGGTALNTVIAGVTVTNATNSAHVLVTDNESTNEENLITFVEDATDSTGNVGLEMDGNLTYNPSTGTVTATVFKGNIDAVDGDFDGTLEADAMTLNGSAITTTATLSTGISNGNVPVFTTGVADDDFLRVNSTSIEGRSASEVLSDISAAPAAGDSNIVTTGALDSGSITSGFGAINNGSSAITTTGAISGGSATISGDLTVDTDTLFVDASADKVGIGTTSPQQDLHVKADNPGGKIRLEMGQTGVADTDVTGEIQFYHNDASGAGVNADIKGICTNSAGAGALTFGTGTTSTTERMRIASDGKLTVTMSSDNTNAEADIGVVHHIKNTSSTNNTGAMISLGSNSNFGTGIYGQLIDNSTNEHNLGFQARNSSGSSGTRMLLTGDGDLFIGVTALPSSSTGGAGFQDANNNRNVLYLATSVTANTSLAVFINGNGQVGGIKTSGSATAFNTSSDYRLKENVSYSWDATSRLKQLKPARFNFINDADTTVDGFLAHEVSSIVPEAISGEKDATEEISNVVLNADGTVKAQGVPKAKWEVDKLSTTDVDGNTIDPIYASDTTWVESKTVPDYQGIDQSKLVPLLVKTIQELEARVTALESA